MVCKYCGSEIENGSIFCDNCGKPTGESADNGMKTSGAASLPEMNFNESSSNESSGKSKKAVVIVVVITLLIIVAALLMYFMKNGRDDPADGYYQDTVTEQAYADFTEIITEAETQAQIKNISEDAVYFNGHYYKLFPNGSGEYDSWNSAERYCESLGGHLAVISSEEENSFLYDYIISLGVETAYFGYTDSAQEDIWEWANGEYSGYSNWHSGEPNGENDNEDYAEFYWKFSNGEWNDGDFSEGTVSDNSAFICEWD